MSDGNLPPVSGPPHVGGATSDMNDEHNSIWYAAINTTRMPIILTNPHENDNPVVFANNAFCKMTGYEKHEIIGKNCRFLQGPDTDRNVVKEIAAAINAREWIATEILNYKKDKSTFWNALYISPVFDLEGNLINYFASQLDVSEKRDINEAYRQSQKMEAVGQLTGGVAHDFNNLLTVIHGYIELLKLNLNSDNFSLEKARRGAIAISTATAQGAKLTAQLLAFARKQKLQGRVVNIYNLVEKHINLIEKTVGDGVNVILEHTGEPLNAKLDSVQLESALLNVAANARDAMNGKGTLTIAIGSLVIDTPFSVFGNIPFDTYAYLTVTDTGCGMDPDVLAKITEPFFTTKEEGKGTGLGMSSVQGFVQQSDGILAIESAIGKGTTIHMIFKKQKGEIEQIAVKANKPMARSQGVKETILIVEDKVSVGDYAEEVLTQYDYIVHRAENAQDALELLHKHSDITVLFSDIIMPGELHGVQLANEVSKLYPKIKILLTTGYTDNSIDLNDSKGIAFTLMKKPYSPMELTENIRNLIDGPDGIS